MDTYFSLSSIHLDVVIIYCTLLMHDLNGSWNIWFVTHNWSVMLWHSDFHFDVCIHVQSINNGVVKRKCSELGISWKEQKYIVQSTCVSVVLSMLATHGYLNVIYVSNLHSSGNMNLKAKFVVKCTLSMYDWTHLKRSP